MPREKVLPTFIIKTIAVRKRKTMIHLIVMR